MKTDNVPLLTLKKNKGTRTSLKKGFNKSIQDLNYLPPVMPNEQADPWHINMIQRRKNARLKVMHKSEDREAQYACFHMIIMGATYIIKRLINQFIFRIYMTIYCMQFYW